MARLTLLLTVLTTLIALLGGFRYFMNEWRLMKLHKRQTGKWLLLVLFCLLPSLAEAAGNEARCDELGANCVCSEPLQATSYANYGTNEHWNPGDTTTKECDVEGTPGAAIARVGSPLDLLASTDATALSRLPSGHSVSRFLAGPNPQLGIFFVGHQMTDSTTYAKRIAFRYYIYHSDTYNFSDEVDPNLGCNSKLMQFNSGLLGDKTHGEVHMYNFTTWPGASYQDCCLTGPGPAGNNFVRADWLGKWWRIEAIMINRNASTSGLHWRMLIYAKNVTDGTAEKLVVDTDEPGTDLNAVNPRIPEAPMNKLLVNNYRGQNFANQCTGWSGISHYIAAGWDTDAGQRIGAATEIEGGGGGGGGGTIALFFNTWWLELVPVAGLFWQARRMILSGVMAIGLFLASTGVLIKTQTQALTHQTKQISYTAATMTMHGVVKVLDKVRRRS